MDAVVLAAGEGTRLRPLTSTRPKPMLPVAGKPILEWNLESLEKSGVKKAYIVVGYRKETIKSYFSKKKVGKMKLEFIKQTKQLGTADAIATAGKKIKGKFIAMNGDVLAPKLIKPFIQSAKKNKNKAMMCLVKVADPKPFGVAKVMRGKVTSLVEKPKRPKSNLINAGLYVFEDSIFDLIKKLGKSERSEVEITDAIKQLIKEKQVGAFTSSEAWIDVGMPWHLLDANEIMLKSIPLKKDKKAVIEKGAVIKGKVHVGAGTLIRSGSYIEGPCYIGKDCVIGPNCYIRAHTSIQNRCHIGNAVELKNSVIMSETNIGHLSYVGDSIIGYGCNWGAGTKVANLKFDDSEVKAEVKGKLEGSGRRKLGCIMGDNVKTGINVSIFPGRSIYPGVYVRPASIVENTLYGE